MDPGLKQRLTGEGLFIPGTTLAHSEHANYRFGDNLNFDLPPVVYQQQHISGDLIKNLELGHCLLLK